MCSARLPLATHRASKTTNVPSSSSLIEQSSRPVAWKKKSWPTCSPSVARMKPKPRSGWIRWTRPRNRTGTRGGSAPEREDISKEVVAESVRVFPESTVPSLDLLRGPALIARIAHRGLSAPVPAAHRDVIDAPPEPAGQAAERPIVEVVDEAVLVEIPPRRDAPQLPARRVGAGPERLPADLAEPVETDDLLGQEAPHAVRLGIDQIRSEADAGELHRVVRRVVQLVGPKAHRAAEAEESHLGMAAEGAGDHLVPALLLDLDIVMEAGDRIGIRLVGEHALDAHAEGADGAEIAGRARFAVLDDEEADGAVRGGAPGVHRQLRADAIGRGGDDAEHQLSSGLKRSVHSRCPTVTTVPSAVSSAGARSMNSCSRFATTRRWWPKRRMVVWPQRSQSIVISTTRNASPRPGGGMTVVPCPETDALNAFMPAPPGSSSLSAGRARSNRGAPPRPDSTRRRSRARPGPASGAPARPRWRHPRRGRRDGSGRRCSPAAIRAPARATPPSGRVRCRRRSRHARRGRRSPDSRRSDSRSPRRVPARS